MSERCQCCGKHYSTVYRAPDEVWRTATGRADGGGLLCIECCDALARACGVRLYWEAAVDRYPTEKANPMPGPCAPGSHDYVDGYYGLTCRLCGDLIPYGCEPWLAPSEEDEEHLAHEEYAHSHGTCECCGGEWGDGWSTCTCDDEEDTEQ